jgi:hypothetical protein
MNKFIKTTLAALVVVAAATSTGCAQLEANALADRAAHPEKYQEIEAVKRAQMTSNGNGAPFPEFCTFGCPETRTDLSRNW